MKMITFAIIKATEITMVAGKINLALPSTLDTSEESQ
jgi:hypothetical protein